VSGRPVGLTEMPEIPGGFSAPSFNVGGVGVPLPNAVGIAGVKSLCGIGVV
jgi:hypothetical protein